MQQRFRRLAVFVGGVVLASSGLVMVACGTDNGETVATPQIEAGKDSALGKDTSTTETEGGPEVDGGPGAADCGAAPKLRSNTAAGGFFCAFYRADGGAADGSASASNCASGQTCCNPAKINASDTTFPPSFCATGKGGDTPCEAQDVLNNSTYTAGQFAAAWECNDKNACTGGDVCVMITRSGEAAGDKVNIGKSLDKDIPASCNALQAFKQGGSRCKPAADIQPDEIRLCSATDDNCVAPTVCTPFSGGFRDLGYCK